MITILQLIGLDDSNLITVLSIKEQPVYNIEQMVPLLDTLDSRRFRVTKFLLGGIEDVVYQVPRTELIFNAVCDPDACSRSLGISERIVNETDIPVINHPKNIRKTRKDTLWHLFGDRDDICIPKTIRISPRRLKEIDQIVRSEEMQFPFLFREAGAQDAQSAFLVDSSERMCELERFAFDGRDYYMTDFIDYRSHDGFYRKYRFFVIGGKVYPGFLIVANHWSIHNDTQARSSFQKVPVGTKHEEKTFLKTFRKKQFPLLKTMHATLGLDFFAADCGFDTTGKPILFGLSSCKHYLSKEKEKDYYDAKLCSQMNRAVERVIERKLNKGRERSE